MSVSIWHLPGPRIFLKRAIELAGQGCSLFIETVQPEDQPEGTLQARLVRKLREAGMNALSVNGSGETPEEHIRREGYFRDEEILHDEELCARLGRLCMIVDNRASANCPWAAFVRRVRHIIRQMPDHARPTFIIICSPTTRSAGVTDDVALKSLSWDHALTQADMVALAEALLAQSHMRPIMRAVIVHVTANLASKNISLLKYLIGKTPEILLQAPSEILNDFKKTAPPHFVQGALLACEKDIMLLVWRAQVEVLFPWVEDMRAQLARDLARWLPPTFGDIFSRDLEIGQLQHLVFGESRIPNPLKNRTAALWNVRNALAHRQGISYSELNRTLTLFAPSL